MKGVIFDDKNVRKMFVYGMPSLNYGFPSIMSWQDEETLYIKEAWRPVGHSFPIGWPYEYRATAKEDGTPSDGRFKYAKKMPLEAARYFVKVRYGRREYGQQEIFFEPVDDPTRPGIYP